jgi:hypothetical protein
MKVLMPMGVVLVAVGMAGSAAACSGTRLLMAPLAGLTLAVGLVCVGIGMGNWRRPIPSDVRPANPWSDQPGEHGDPPKGLV